MRRAGFEAGAAVGAATVSAVPSKPAALRRALDSSVALALLGRRLLSRNLTCM